MKQTTVTMLTLFRDADTPQPHLPTQDQYGLCPCSCHCMTHFDHIAFISNAMWQNSHHGGLTER